MRRFIVIVAFLTAVVPAHADLITFEDFSLPPSSYENGSNLAGSFTSDGAVFNNSNFGSFWTGWSYSNIVNTTTAGYQNQYASFAGGGDDSAIYGIGNSFNPGDATIDLVGRRPLSLSVTNTTYVALSMRDGDQFAKKFDSTDYFTLTITGIDAAGRSTGFVNFDLAANGQIVSTWTTVDLAALGEDTVKLSFGLTSSDNDPDFGMNTPAYFAIDNVLTTAAVPEPSSLVLAGLAGAAFFGRWRKRRLMASRAA